jgi:hypothetical protein
MVVGLKTRSSVILEDNHLCRCPPTVPGRVSALVPPQRSMTIRIAGGDPVRRPDLVRIDLNRSSITSRV